MSNQDLIGIVVAAFFPIFVLAEHFWPARRFPKISWWNTVGIALFFYVGILNTIVIELLPMEWLNENKLFNLSQIGLLPSILIGHLFATLAMYSWHRATHKFDFLWRCFHQLHHSPRRLTVYVMGYNHPLDLAIYITLPFLIGLFILGMDPFAAAMLGNLAGFNAFLQHSNLRTPRWLAIFFQRPEAHCIHHQRGLHRYNYSDLPLWDFVFGTFRNPHSWEGETGFDQPGDRRYLPMLAFVDVNKPLLGEHSFGQNLSKDGAGRINNEAS